MGVHVPAITLGVPAITLGVPAITAGVSPSRSLFYFFMFYVYMQPCGL